MSRLPRGPSPGSEIAPADRIIFSSDEEGRHRAKDQIPPFELLFDKSGFDQQRPSCLITTSMREQSGKRTSYPIGAETISRTLQGLPHFDEASITFWGLSTWSRGRGEPIPVMSMYFHRSSYDRHLALNGLAPTWHLSVSSVPQPLRHTVRIALVEAGLPLLRHWLRNIGNLEGRDGEVSLRISIRDDGMLLVSETIQLKPRLSRTSLAIC